VDTGDDRGGIDINFTEGPGEGCLDLTDGASGQYKRVVMVMEGDSQDGQGKTDQTKEKDFFNHRVMHCPMTPRCLYVWLSPTIHPRDLSTDIAKIILLLDTKRHFPYTSPSNDEIITKIQGETLCHYSLEAPSRQFLDLLVSSFGGLTL
jgi:hypothetical protein